MQLLTARRWPSILRSLTGLWLVSFLTFGPTLAAATLTVDDDGPADFSSITAALAAANATDTIQVAAGLYDESRETFPLALKDGVAIIGAGRDTTTILAGADTPAFSNEATPLGPTTRLEGFEVTQESGSDQSLLEFILGDATMSPVIEDNRFLGNVDEDDGGVAVIAEGLGGTFDSSITGNEFLTFGIGGSVGPASIALAVETASGGGVVMGRVTSDVVLEKLQSDGLRPAIAPPDEDQITPTISGNTFEGNGFGVAVIGSSYFDCSCEDSGIMSPDIDDNDFVGNGLDVLLVYAGFGFREFSPTVSNNTSNDSSIFIGSLPYFYGPGTTDAALESGAPSSGRTLAMFKRMKKNMDEGRMGKGRRAASGKGRRAAASKRAVRPSGALPPDPSALYDVTISGNTITNPALAGMFFYNYMYASGSVTLSAAITDNNVASTDAQSGILFGAVVDAITPQLPGAIRFENNEVAGAVEALAIFLVSELPAPVTASRVKPMEAAANDIQIIGNRLENGALGLGFVSNGYTTLAPLVSCNVIINHSDTGVIILESSDPNPDFGGGARSSPGLNSIHDNEVDMSNEDADEVKAENNFWGTTDSTTIDANTDGAIDFTPFLLAEPIGCGVVVPTDTADLALTKVVTSTGPYVVGSNISYQLTVTNNGPDPATNVEITDPIPPGTDFVSASAGCTASLTEITCTAATLADDASLSFDITLVATASGVVVNTASADGDEDDPNATNEVATASPVTVGAPAIAAVPTASEWGLMLMGVMLAFVGLWFSRRS